MKKKITTKKQFSNKLIHVGVVVRDMDKAIKRLEGLGIGPFKPYDFESLPPLKGPLLFRGRPYEGEVKLFVGHMGNVVLEIFQPLWGDSPQKEFLDNKGEGIHHLGFTMDDFDREVSELTEKGASVLHSARHVTGGGSVYLDMGVGGLIFELEKLT
jgi:methylmalonyl-CoA/ethylmalonyl-CoA epimerase